MVTPRPAASTEQNARTAIVSAATRLFAAHGFDGTAIQDVADAVGVTKPAVLHHFPSKEHIRQAVLDAMLAHWKERLPRLLLASATEDRFDAVLGELRRFFADDPDRARLVVREMLDRPIEMKKLLRGAVKPWLAAVASYVRAGAESGRHFADVDAEAYVLHIFQLVISATASAAVSSSVLEVQSGRRSVGQTPDGLLGARARYDAELVRIARASLFPPITVTPASRPKKRSR